jgi:hypothetical protein
MAERWLFPLGHYLGPFFPGQGADLDGHRVRVGQEVVTLFGDTEFTVWALAHGVPGSSGVRGTRHAVEAALREQTGADAGAAVDELLRDGVLLEVGDGANDPVEFARRYRFRSMMVGLGASAEQPDRFHIGLTGRPLATVDGLAFEFWEWAPLHPTLWAAWQAAAAVETALGGSEPVVDGALDRLQVLLAAGCGYLDVALD